VIALPLVLSLLALALLGTRLLSALAWPALAWIPARRVPVALTAVVAAGAALAAAAVVPVHGASCHCLMDAPAVLPVALVALLPLLAPPALALARLIRSARATRAILRSCVPSDATAALLLTEIPIRNAFAVGARGGRVVADRAWWGGLEDWERRAILAHERAHLRRRDPAVLTLLSLAASLLPSRVASPLVDRWRLRAEQCADAAAAAEVGDSAAIAELLVRQHRPRDARPIAHPALAGACSLEHRVEALLHGSGEVDDAAPGLAPSLAAIAAAAVAAGLAAPAVHDVAETVIAWLR
jgi:Zn-dependent protease with chaperone function